MLDKSPRGGCSFPSSSPTSSSCVQRDSSLVSPSWRLINKEEGQEKRREGKRGEGRTFADNWYSLSQILIVPSQVYSFLGNKFEPKSISLFAKSLVNLAWWSLDLFQRKFNPADYPLPVRIERFRVSPQLHQLVLVVKHTWVTKTYPCVDRLTVTIIPASIV